MRAKGDPRLVKEMAKYTRTARITLSLSTHAVAADGGGMSALNAEEGRLLPVDREQHGVHLGC